nr:unnamed protein product [Callosobruchus chinensis]
MLLEKVPCSFPNLQAYPAKSAVKERLDPKLRRATIVERHENELEKFLKSGMHSSDEYYKNFPNKLTR